MELGDTIKYYRKCHHMTQEELAEQLHVSHAAISKWERGLTYPDIKLLPIMARVFHTDVNTLLSFTITLEEKEIAAIIQPIHERMQFEEAFQVAQEQLFRYPDCAQLRLACADLLMERCFTADESNKNVNLWEEQLLDWYHIVSESNDRETADQGTERLIAYYLRKEDYAKAKELLQQLQKRDYHDAEQLTFHCLLAEKQYEKAEKLCEDQLYQQANALVAKLQQLTEIRRKQKHYDTLNGLANIIGELCDAMRIWPYPHLLTAFENAVVKKDRVAICDVFEKMLTCFETPKKDDILYLHLENMPLATNLRTQCNLALIRYFQSENLAFMKQDERYMQLLASLQRKVEKEKAQA